MALTHKFLWIVNMNPEAAEAAFYEGLCLEMAGVIPRSKREALLRAR